MNPDYIRNLFGKNTGSKRRPNDLIIAFIILLPLGTKGLRGVRSTYLEYMFTYLKLCIQSLKIQ